MTPAGVKYFWEDIVCKYWKWARRAGGLENCDMKPALSVMHAKGHSWTCQVIMKMQFCMHNFSKHVLHVNGS